MIGFFAHHIYYDESKAISQNCRQLQYAIALNDIHNFWLPIKKYRSLFRDEYWKFKLSVDDVEIDRATVIGNYLQQNIGFKERIESRTTIDEWKDKNFPETVSENIKILDDYLTLCEKNKIVPVMCLPPMTEGYKKHFSRKKLDEFYCLVQDALNKHNTAKFFDGWQLEGFSDADFLNVDHANISGATKFSTAVNNFIEQL